MVNRVEMVKLIEGRRDYRAQGDGQGKDTEDILLFRGLEVFFEGESEEKTKRLLDDIMENISDDLENLSKAYRYVYYDIEEVKEEFFDGLELVIEYYLSDDNSVIAEIDEEKLRSHLKRTGKNTLRRRDRITYLTHLYNDMFRYTCRQIWFVIAMLTERRQAEAQ